MPPCCVFWKRVEKPAADSCELIKHLGGGAGLVHGNREAVGCRHAGQRTVDGRVGDQLLGVVGEAAEGNGRGRCRRSGRCRRLQRVIVEACRGEILLNLREPGLEAGIEAGELTRCLGRALRNLGEISQAVDGGIKRKEFLIVLLQLGVAGGACRQRHIGGVQEIGGGENLGGLGDAVGLRVFPGRIVIRGGVVGLG